MAAEFTIFLLTNSASASEWKSDEEIKGGGKATMSSPSMGNSKHR